MLKYPGASSSSVAAVAASTTTSLPIVAKNSFGNPVYFFNGSDAVMKSGYLS